MTGNLIKIWMKLIQGDCNLMSKMKNRNHKIIKWMKLKKEQNKMMKIKLFIQSKHLENNKVFLTQKEKEILNLNFQREISSSNSSRQKLKKEETIIITIAPIRYFKQ